VLYKIDYEYQYFLTDHQGNVRVVLQTSPTGITTVATMETENCSYEDEGFLDYDEDDINFIEVNPVAKCNAGWK
jgi:hypothetical protein